MWRTIKKLMLGLLSVALVVVGFWVGGWEPVRGDYSGFVYLTSCCAFFLGLTYPAK